jgi:hypothetical protein
MRKSWSISSSESIRERLDTDWTGGIGLDLLRRFYIIYFLKDLGPVQMASAWVFTTSGEMSSGGGVSPCTQSAERLLIEL